MSEVSNLLQALRIIQDGDAWHGPALQKTLDGITAEQAAKRPAPGLHSIWELVLHIAAWERVFCDRLEGQSKVQPEEGDFPAVDRQDEASWQRALQFLKESHDRLIDVVSRMKEADLQRTVPGKEFSVAFMLHGIVRHHVYHAGQIGLIRKMAS